MSYINDALKKAQELKDSGHSKYHSVVKTSVARHGALGRKILVYSLAVLFIAALLLSIQLWRGQNKGMNTGGDSGPSPAQKASQASANKDLYEKALGLYGSGKITEAKKIYEAILGLDPGYVEALNNLGIIYIHEKDFTAAKNNLEKAVRLNPAYVESYYNLACLCAIKGDIDQGIGHLKKAVSLDKNVKEWAKSDSDLQNLRKSEAFNKLLSN
jgi:tetratricopeptide (TPR) repeat protein